jgi:hypothetical protein
LRKGKEWCSIGFPKTGHAGGSRVFGERDAARWTSDIENFRPQDRTIGMTSSRPSAAPAGSRFTAVSLQQSANFSEKEITFFLNVDFVNHVDLVAMTIKQP